MSKKHLTVEQRHPDEYWLPDTHYNLVDVDGISIVFGVDDEATAEKIARACNMHDELVNALEMINRRIFAQGLALGSDDYFFVSTLCVAAVKKARGQS